MVFPKGTDFDEVAVKDIQWAEDWINSYPRRVLGWRSADAAMRECLEQAAYIKLEFLSGREAM